MKKKPGFENTRIVVLTPLVMAENPWQGIEKYHYEKDLKNIYDVDAGDNAVKVWADIKK